VRLCLLERNEGDFSTFVGFCKDEAGRKYKVVFEPVDPAARPARQSTTWFDDDDEEEEAAAAAAAAGEA
jgi:hypothetical protein